MTAEPQDDDDEAAIYARLPTKKLKKLWLAGKAERERIRKSLEAGRNA